MPIVSFWNPVENAQTSNTSSIVAVASMLLWKSKYKALITQTHYSDFTMESAFFRYFSSYLTALLLCNQLGITLNFAPPRMESRK